MTLQQDADKYENRRSSGLIGNTIESYENADNKNRVRNSNNSLNVIQSRNYFSTEEGLQAMREESMFLFSDSLLLKKSSGKEIFGHNIFRNKNLTFEPSVNIATPKNYKLGPGDEVIIDIWGASQVTVRETISPDGNIMVDDLGPVT